MRFNQDYEPEQDYDPEKEERKYSQPFAARYPFLYIFASLILTFLLGAMLLAFWIMILGRGTYWPLTLSFLGVIAFCYWWYKKGVSQTHVPKSYKIEKKKQVLTPAPDTMTDKDIEKAIKKSKKWQNFLKKRGRDKE